MTTGDLEDFKFEEEIRTIWLKYGFSSEEADVAADESLHPDVGSKWLQIRRLLQNRLTAVKRRLQAKKDWVWEDAVAFFDNARRTAAVADGYDEMNLFVGTT